MDNIKYEYRISDVFVQPQNVNYYRFTLRNFPETVCCFVLS